MKAIIADVYAFYINNSKNVKFPKIYKNYHIIWNLREALLVIWEGNITELAIPEAGTPGYNFEEFIDQMLEQGQIDKKPKLKYYNMNIV